MMPRLIVRTVVLAALVSGVALAFDGDPPTSNTGAPAVGGRPAEGACSCHNEFALNTNGSVVLLNAPSHYTPGATYAMTVRITSGQTAGSSNRLWGFQLTAVKASDGNGTGTFANVAGQGTMIAPGNGQFGSRSYIEVSGGNRQGTASPVEWQVQWTAPNPGVGQILFFFSGIAAGGDGGTGGDWIYTGSWSSVDITPVLRGSWGAIKRQYR